MLAVLFVVAVCAVGVGAQNVLVVGVDQLSFRYVSAYRGTHMITPNIDWLSTNGLRFDNFYATDPVCTPSRGSFQSGLYPSSHGAVSNSVPLFDNVTTFAEVLAANGYATGYSGKWHLDGIPRPGWAPVRQFGWDDNRYMWNRGHWKRIVDTESGPEADGHAELANVTSYTTDYLANKAIDFFTHQTLNQTRWCYMVSFPDPHPGFTVRTPFDTLYPATEPLPDTFFAPLDERPRWAGSAARSLMPGPYRGMIANIDYNVGRLLYALDSLGVLNDTIVVFTSDHGEMAGEHAKVGKGVPYEASVRVPFVLYYPRVFAPTVVSRCMGSVDFAPTLYGLLGIPASGVEQGTDQSRALLRNTSAPGGFAYISHAPHGGEPEWIGIVSVRWKLILDTYGDPWLFNRRDDPDELGNYLQTARASLLTALGKRLEKHIEKHNRIFLGNPQVIEQLQNVIAGNVTMYPLP